MSDPVLNSYEKKGFLNQDFRIFHLKEEQSEEVSLHYHDFYKVLVFINGNVNYIVEGNNYILKPQDIILVNAGELHRPLVQPAIPYERIILYLSKEFLHSPQMEKYELAGCFQQTRLHGTHRIRISDLQKKELNHFQKRFINSNSDTQFAAELLNHCLVTEFIIWLNRLFLANNLQYEAADTANSTVLSIMDYINLHLREDLSIDSIARHFFLNRSYIMHLFKKETGCTIGTYLTEKRLFLAKKMLQEGSSVTEACFQSGFKNYACFYRAFREKFDTSPKNSRD